MELLKQLFTQHFGTPVLRLQPLQDHLGGSGRRIIRLAGEGRLSAIGILYNEFEENRAFIEFSRHFRGHGLPVPEIYAEDLSHGAYLTEDLGDTTLFSFLSKNRNGNVIAPEAIQAYRKAIAVLPRFQVEAGRDLDYSVCYPRDSFDRQSMAWDLNYFKYYFLKLAGIHFNEQGLEDDFSRLTDFLLSADRDYFLYRDFQSRNIMLREGDPWFLDYQGGRKGALQYDIASLLYDSKAELTSELRQQLLDCYLESLGQHVNITRERFMLHYYAYVYVRLMQAMGAYGFRGFYERKPHFLQSVPYAINNLRWLLENVELRVSVPTLMAVFQSLVASDKLHTATIEAGTLVVHIQSFSFKQGLPKDESGHGGGFVLDCRALPNPGRLERFKNLTGRDAAVMNYLMQQESVHKFLDHAKALVDLSVTNYVRRGFKSLTVSFGCTGGQHRSVYMAEELAKHLSGRHGVQLIVKHCELEKLTEPV
jgi:aminoglycoside/choline kinase family phosphotransferase